MKIWSLGLRVWPCSDEQIAEGWRVLYLVERQMLVLQSLMRAEVAAGAEQIYDIDCRVVSGNEGRKMRCRPSCVS